MKLIDDWKSIVRKAWSIRLLVIAGLLSGLEVICQVLEPSLAADLPNGVFASLSGLVTAAALVARVLAQNEAQANTDVKP